MILIDPRQGSRELLSLIVRLGYAAELASPPLAYADFCFEGNGPAGLTTIGIERKSLHDLLHCIDDARYAGTQRGGMKLMYGISFLAVEGMYRPHDPDGYLMEGFQGGKAWGPCKYRQQTPPYSKVFNYLISVALSGVIITPSRDIVHTAFNVCQLYDYFQKPWADHTSMLEVQLLPLAGVGGKPSLVKRWAAQIDGIGVKLSEHAEAMFPTPRLLANADPSDWVRIRGISPKTALRIEKEIREGR